MNPVKLTFRQAVPAESDLLTGICQRAKQSHGYDEEMMKIFLGDGDMVISADAIVRETFMLALIEERVVGFAHLMPVDVPETVYLENLFIEPDVQGLGVGRALFNWALVEAGNRGFRWLEWDSDPNASAFYVKMGGEQISHQESTLFPGRIIPKFRRANAPVATARARKPQTQSSGEIAPIAIQIRKAVSTDSAHLSAICRRAKASLGYDETILDLWACQGDMQFDPGVVDAGNIALAVVGDSGAGFAHVRSTGAPDELFLEDLFVDPDFQGHGIGRGLFDWARNQARIGGYRWLTWESDPLSADYYRKLGAEQFGEEQSTLIPVRSIPMFRIAIAPELD